MNRRNPQNRNREGVALIVVLGFLSILMVLAVAFWSTARTEEEVSDYSQEAIRCRQLLRSGLAAAMNDYSRELWKDEQYLPDDDLSLFPSESSGMDAISGSAGTLRGSQTQLLRGEALDWIPARYLRDSGITNDVGSAEWVLVREDPGKSSRILGRYAYVCFDCSGGLDANFVALDDDVASGDSRAMTNRLRRTLRSVPIGLLPEVAEGGDASQFKSYRRGWKGFDSPQMLVKLTDGRAEDGNGSANRWQVERKETHGPGLASNLVSELTSYSLSAYRGGRYSRSSGTWTRPNYIDPASGNGWRAAFAPIHSQLSVSDENFERMIGDFTSSQVVPQGVTYPSVKNVPMFNEVIIRNIHLNAPTKKYVTVDGVEQETWEYKAKVEIQFEFWYPFPSKDNEIGSPFVLEAPTLSMQSYPGAANFKLQVALQTTSGQIIRVTGEPEAQPARLEVKAKYNNGKPYVTEAFTYTVTFASTDGKRITDEACKMLMIQQIETGADLDLTTGSGEPVDRLPKGLVQRISTIRIDAGSTCDRSFAWEALDPRLNHMLADWEIAMTDGGSPDEINECTKNYAEFTLEGSAMYCRNKQFETPADFGFFSIGKPWKTVDLLCDEGAQFLALTTMDDSVHQALEKNGVFYTNAQLNVNTHCSNALASAFYMLSTMEVPGWDAEDHEGIDSLEEEDAREFAARIMEITEKTPFQSGMDWAAIPAMGKNGWLQSKGLNRNQREALIRNTYGLFSVADSLFLVVVVAQSVKEGPDESKVGTWDDEDQITGERRGIALVWRDPFKTGTNAHHEMMVRMFRYLND